MTQDEDDDFYADEIDALNRAIMVGQVIAADLGNKSTSLHYLVEKARTTALEAGRQLLECDLYSEQGLERARDLQREYQRFQAIIEWIARAGNEADAALSMRAGMDVEEEQLRRQANYERSGELPDV